MGIGHRDLNEKGAEPMDFGGAFTDRLLQRADLSRGAKALDIGCGTGDVTFRLAAIVGDEGHVVGIDRDGAALQTASARAREDGVGNISFENRDIGSLADQDLSFDAITCRRVLMYLADQVEVAAMLGALLRPGGLLIVQEHDASILHSSHPVPLYERARSWIWDTVRAEGANVRTGFELHGILSAAGFTDIDVHAEPLVPTPDDTGPTATIVKVMEDRVKAAGVATSAEMDVGTLQERLAEERRSSVAITIGELVFGAIARKPH